ncbi:Gfo/Idh/MocA family protein [Adhaeribacter aquaticus]|uniref:Gfo/Idh/MocA family protein n=1 Tax=Adhaeribacter aquaticus TaxID=299567 RepID=UPI0003FF2792|nr:Gfo/Idh/MocA family oxidoreductase [Adhaeribacter aquaticus]
MLNRRKFIRTAALASTTFMVGSELSAMSYFKGSPNKKVVLGIMGSNSRGLFLARNFATMPNVEVGYICDPDSKVVDKTIAAVAGITGKKPKGIADVRKLLEMKDMDALVIAAPDHWHAPATIMACQAGKHVYVEKPCSHNPYEGEMAVAAARKYKRMVQMGSQRRSFTNVQAFIKELHDGIIGRVYFAKGWYDNSRKSIGFGKQVPVPAHLNYELWQGPAPRKPYQDNVVHYNWHWFWNWGTGESLNNGTHELDVMRWGLGVDFPDKVTSSGGRFHFKDDWETPDTQTILFNFSNNTAMQWEGRSCNGYPTEGDFRGVIFYGDKGTLYYGGANSYKVFDDRNKLVKEVKDNTPFDANNTVSPLEQLDVVHLQNFVAALRGDAPLNCEIIQGHKSTLLPQLGNISYRVGRTLICNPENGHILNDDESMRLWKRDYERGWHVQV